MDKKQRVLQWLEDHKEEQQKLLSDLIRIRSFSGEEYDVQMAVKAYAEKAGFAEILNKYKAKPAANANQEKPKAPAKEVVTAQISGIEITELDEAVEILWGAGIYAESGMGCTGPIVLVNESNLAKARELLVKNGKVQG